MGLTRREFLKATGAFIASNAFNLPSSLAKPKEKKIKKFYLTIDDGPSHYTHLILSALFELGWKATFFVIGKQIDKYKKQLKEVLLAGHEV
jgi:peptidoglycan/xylan/chitin deacetylase (PgdA/CDA1 family)